MKNIYMILMALCLTQIVSAQVSLTTNFSNTTLCAGNSTTITANVTPYNSNIVYTWSPADGLNTTTGQTVIATPENTTTYTVTAVDQSTSATASAMVTVSINNNSYSLAGYEGGPQVCQNVTIFPGGSVFRGGDCKLIAGITPSGNNPVSGSVNTCVKVENGPGKMGSSNLFVARHYDLEPASNAASATAKVVLYFTQKEFDDYNAKAEDSGVTKLPSSPDDDFGISNLILRQYHGTGTAPINYTGSSVDFTFATSEVNITYDTKADWWEISLPVAGFSGFYITSKKGNFGVLPITMEYFKGAQADKVNNLTWKANCSSTGAIFQVERSNNGINYSSLTVINADLARCSTPFNYTDAKPLDGKNYYRIKLSDIDGRYSYSNIITLNSKIKAYEISMNPNIIRGDLANLSVVSAEAYEMIVLITDITGRKMQHQTIKLRQGKNLVNINTATISSGTYLLSTLIQGEEAQTIKFIKQ